MIKLKSIQSKLGYIDIFTNEEQSLLYAIPNGYVGPSLVKKDLTFLFEFDRKNDSYWTYIVDTSKVKAVHPLNPLFLKGLKDFKKMKAYIVYAPSPFVRWGIQLSSWINKPDRIIKDRNLLQEEFSISL